VTPAPDSPTLAAVVRQQIGVAWSKARALCADGRVTVNGERWLDPAARVPPDAVVVVNASAPKSRAGALARTAIVHADRDLVVVEKPAGMLSVADEAGNRDTLVDHARTALRKVDRHDVPLGVVHRLDRETSGLMVFARSAEAKRRLQACFKSHEIDRTYHAIVHGRMGAQRIETYLLADRGDGLRGSHGHFRKTRGAPPPEARVAITHVAPLEALRAATLVECRLETGRQHQIRIHLAEAGHPLAGESVYIRDYEGPRIAAPRIMLHARTLAFVHPGTGREVAFEREVPDDFKALLDTLRR